MDSQRDLVALTSQIVASFLAGNQIAQRDIPDLIRSVHAALADVASSAPAQAQEAPEPAVAIKKSITADFIICLEDGKKFKSLKRHLRTRYAMSPEEYRAKWGLPHDYPMVAPNYAKERSSLAKRMGLGQSRRAD
jgi:predicted transcriptional regulator